VLPGARAGKIVIGAKKVLEDVHIGDSIAVNGVCLTVVAAGADEFMADVMPETLRKSGLGTLKVGDPVDLERAMAANGRFGGHIVSGHIDGVGRIVETRREENAVIVTISAPAEILALIVEKGSIAVNGVSLTVSGLGDDWFRVDVIPTTLRDTNLGFLKIGDRVNLETDVLGKYARKQSYADDEPSSERSSSGLTMDTLIENGFV
jgi:riboflavin synthase